MIFTMKRKANKKASRRKPATTSRKLKRKVTSNPEPRTPVMADQRELEEATRAVMADKEAGDLFARIFGTDPLSTRKVAHILTVAFEAVDNMRAAAKQAKEAEEKAKLEPAQHTDAQS